MKKVIFCISVITLLVIVVCGYLVQQSRAEERSVKEKMHVMAQEKKALNVQSKATDVNQAFLRMLFGNQSIEDKQKQAKVETTAKGFAMAFPSAGEPQKETDLQVVNEIDHIEMYHREGDAGSYQFLTVIEVTTSVNNIRSTNKMLIQTILVKKKQQFLVDNVLILTNL
ncbi:hypothetical protein HB904_11050 [Listeria booriae]|uniref:Uncharacterized protein n=1 Tax=Listeria booriae TaxID=1552123 RepID=A0A841YL36_9LIST|nr:hypothetical protein [Listeria booriae]MBC1400883.1 hypothetical protein [Listeria booriae]MBC1616730.1 hypothetical protein [Listeria booriae]